MIYTNLLIFISAIFLFSLDPAGAAPSRSPAAAMAVYAVTMAAFWLLARRVFRRPGTKSPEGYFGAEKRLSIGALLFFAIALFVGDIKYYLAFISFSQRLPVLTNILGLLLFFSYLALMWAAGSGRYAAAFDRRPDPAAFVVKNFRQNLPLVLPWVALSLMYDLLALIPSPALGRLLDGIWGDLLFLGLFLLLVLLFFPPLVRRLWHCKPLPEGPLKEHLVGFCRSLNFEADLHLWPLYEGRILTAAVLGLLPGLRYIMLTPALLQHLDVRELEAVLAHEIAHVKYRHLLLYLLLIGGFSLITGLLAEPLLYLALSGDWIFSLMARDLVSAETIVMLAGGLPLLILLLLYFRYVFGYFIRNFERQADLYVFKALGSGRQLISAFEKIVVASGQRADQPNWHHFGIGERIAHLELCARDPSAVATQDRKVRVSLLAYLLVLVTAAGLIRQVPAERLARTYEGKYIETVLMPRLHGGTDEASWHRLLGDLMFNHGLEDKALTAYHKALQLAPEDPEVLNNLAWLLLTSGDPAFRDPPRALALARKAAERLPLPHVLDTLATAYWATGDVDAAIRTQILTLQSDSDQSPFYRLQLERFRTERYRSDTSFIN